MVFTAGLHDVYRNAAFSSDDDHVLSGATKAYADGLARMLALLAKLAPSRLFLSMERRSIWAKPNLDFEGLDIVARVNSAMVRQSNQFLHESDDLGANWTTAIDASPLVHALPAHCARFTYDSTHVGFSSTANCTVFATCIGRLLLACAAHILPPTRGSADAIQWWPHVECT